MILKLADTDVEFLNKYKGIYKFYVNECFLDDIIDKLCLERLDLRFIETLIFEDEIYYCVYVGECEGNSSFDNRVKRKHIKGRIRGSTLRKTLSGVLNLNKDELTKLLTNQTADKRCFFVILPVNNQNKISKFEKIIINSSIHILNKQKNEFYNVKNNIFGKCCNFIKNGELLKDLREKAHN